MSNTVSVIIPAKLRDRAGNLRINVSKVAREALAVEVEKVEKERGIATEANTPNAPQSIPLTKESDT